MNVNDFFKKTKVFVNLSGSQFLKVRPRIVCKDGVSLSVQVSSMAYCTPRRDDCDSYLSAEVGYPTIRPPEDWREYFDGIWQHLGFRGWVARIWSRRSSILYEIKRTRSLRSRYLRLLLSTKDNSCLGVYGYVPIEMIDAFIEDHGGIDEEKTFRFVDFLLTNE